MEAGSFAVLSEEAATDLLLTKDAANTKKANLRAYRTFRSYLNERNYDQTNFEEWETARLDEVLAKFYSEASNLIMQIVKFKQPDIPLIVKIYLLCGNLY